MYDAMDCFYTLLIGLPQQLNYVSRMDDQY